MKGLLWSFRYAFRGFFYQLSYERNFRIHCFAALTVLLASGFYELSKWEWCFLILLIAVVIAAESLNTAVEQTDNAVTEKLDERIRRAKDSAAAGVLMLAVASVAIAVLLFWDLEAFRRIAAFFTVWWHALLLVLYFAAGAFFIFCKRTYKK